MGDAVFRAARLFWDNRDAWNQLVTQAMSQDFSWTRSADKYLDLYFFMHPEIERPAAVVDEPVVVAEKVEAEPEPKAESVVEAPAAAEEPKAEEKPAAKLRQRRPRLVRRRLKRPRQQRPLRARPPLPSNYRQGSDHAQAHHRSCQEGRRGRGRSRGKGRDRCSRG